MPSMTEIYRLLNEINIDPNDRETKVRIILNGGKGGLVPKDWWIGELNGHANTLVYKLHKARENELLQLKVVLETGRIS